MTVVLDGIGLTIDDVVLVARGHEQVELSAAAIERARAEHVGRPPIRIPI